MAVEVAAMRGEMKVVSDLLSSLLTAVRGAADKPTTIPAGANESYPSSSSIEAIAHVAAAGPIAEQPPALVPSSREGQQQQDGSIEVVPLLFGSASQRPTALTIATAAPFGEVAGDDSAANDNATASVGIARSGRAGGPAAGSFIVPSHPIAVPSPHQHQPQQRRRVVVLFRATMSLERWADDYSDKGISIGFTNAPLLLSGAAQTATSAGTDAAPSTDSVVGSTAAFFSLKKEDYYPIAHTWRRCSWRPSVATGGVGVEGAATLCCAHSVAASVAEEGGGESAPALPHTCAHSLFGWVAAAPQCGCVCVGCANGAVADVATDGRFSQKEYPTVAFATSRRYAILLEWPEGDTNSESEGRWQPSPPPFFCAFRSDDGTEAAMRPLWARDRCPLAADSSPLSPSAPFWVAGSLEGDGDSIAIDAIYFDGDVPAVYCAY